MPRIWRGPGRVRPPLCPHGHHWSGQPPRHDAHPPARRPRLWDLSCSRPGGAPLAQYLSEVSADPAVAAVEPNADVVVPESPTGLQLNQSTASILDALASPMNFRDPSGMDIAVIENGPTAGNPIGHTSIAITGQGVYS